jgi:integrase
MPYRQKNGTYRATKTINGKRKQAVFKTQAEAKKWEANQSAETWEQEARPILTALALATQYLDWAKERFSAKTFREKRLALDNALRFIGLDTPVEGINPKDILDALRLRAMGSGNAANKDRKNLVAMWSWGVRYLKLPKENPFQAMEKFSHDQRPRYVPSEADFWKAYALAEPDDQAFLLTALHTAARRGELFRLGWPDVDFKARTIRLGTRKTATGGLEYATLPMTSKLSASLSALRSRGPRSMLVFSQVNGEPYTNRQHYMERLCRRAGVRPFGFHAIRHLSASILAREGVDIPTIQAILRHKSPTTTARYLHSLGIVENVLDDVFCGKQKAPGVGSSEGL